MSSILKALKKLENDKSICKPEQLRIDSKILQEASSTKLSGTTLFIVAIALFICGGGATFLYMKRSTSDGIASQTLSQRNDIHITAPTISPVMKIDTLDPNTAPISPPKIPPAAIKRLPDNIAPQKMQPSPPEIKTAAPIQAPAHAPIPEARATASKSTTAKPILTVNGIAYQDESNDNLAVINGITVSSGAVIEGVKVEDIQKDRVHFSQGGEKFEIILNKSNR